MSDDHVDQAARNRRQRLLDQIQAHACQWSRQRFVQALDGLEQELFRLANIAGDNLNQGRYWQARNALIRQRQRAEDCFGQALAEAWSAFLRGEPCRGEHPAATAATPPGSLSLVDDASLERTLAIDGLGRRASIASSETLYALQQRLTALSAGRKIAEPDNPVAPRVIAEALERALCQFPSDDRSHLLALKFCDGAFMAHLPALYRELNRQLREAGVLPNLRYELRKSQGPGSAGAHPAEPGHDTGAERAQSASRQRELLALIRNLRGTALPAATAPLANLVPILASLQRDSARELASADAIVAAPPQPAQAQAQARHDGMHHDLIELVGFLFEYMLADEQLPDAAKALLSYLHTPYLKLALIDPSLAENPEHPARTLLNSLVAAGEQWLDPDDAQRGELFRRMKALVQRILDEFSDNPGLFTELDAEFGQFLEQHGQRVQRAEQRAREAAEGEQRLRNARLQAEQFIRRRTRKQRLDDALTTLLRGPWCSYLAFTILRHGTDSEAWRRAGGSVDDILWYAAATPAQREAQRERAEAVLAELQHGLQTVGYDSTSALLAALQQPGAPVPAPRGHHAAPSRPQPSAERPRAKPAPPDALQAQLQALGFGTWFLFGADQPRRQQQRLKLAWSNRRTGHFMFVNTLGQQAAVHSLHALADAVRHGRARILGDIGHKPFIERALERIAEQLGRRDHAPQP